MNEQIAQLQDSDPEFARTLKRLRVASYGLAAAIILAAGLGLWAVVVNSEQATQITKIQKTPCTLNPEGKACTTIKERLARHGSLKSPCIEHQRVEGTKGRNCPQFYVPPSQRQVHSESIQGLEQSGGEAKVAPTPTGGTGGVKAPNGGSGHAPAPGHPGSHEPSAPPNPGPSGEQSPAAPAPPSGSAPVSDEPVPPAEETQGPEASSSTPGLLDNPGGIVGEVVCSVNALGIRVCTE